MNSSLVRFISLLATATIFVPAPAVAGRTDLQPHETRTSDEPDLGLADLHLVGIAKRRPHGNVRLVHGGHRVRSGAAYTSEPVDVTTIDLTVGFRVRGSCADGLTMIIQGDDVDALGGGGGSLGYGRGRPPREGISHSLAIELDLWQNDASDFGEEGVTDPDVPHLSLHTRGTDLNDANPLYSIASRPTVDVLDGQLHRARVRYADHTMRISVDRGRWFSTPIDLVEQLGLTEGTAYVGMTAGTGGCGPWISLARFRLDLPDDQ